MVKWREKFNNWLETSNIGETQTMCECDKRHAWPWFDNKNLESGYWCKFITSSVVVFITSDFHIFPSIGKKKQIQSNNSSSEILALFLNSFTKCFFPFKACKCIFLDTKFRFSRFLIPWCNYSEFFELY